MAATLVDSNVLLDVITEDDEWLDWSAAALSRAANDSALVINPIVYAEVAARFTRIEDLEAALPLPYYQRRCYTLIGYWPYSLPAWSMAI